MSGDALVLPRIVLEAFPNELLKKKKRRDEAIHLILEECKEMDYDGIVLESWSRWAAYGVLQDPEMRSKALQFVKELGEALHSNDLLHAWGLDFQLGYCAQGDRTQNIGVVDSEYIVHQGLPTLGALDLVKSNFDHAAQTKDTSNLGATVVRVVPTYDNRMNVRRQSFIEQEIFRTRWRKAVEEDQCWKYPTQQPSNQTGSIRK